MERFKDGYMSPREIKQATDDLHVLLSEVLLQQQRSKHLVLTEISVYQPTGSLTRLFRGLAPLIFKVKPDELVAMKGLAFGKDHPARNGVIVSDGITIAIATRLPFPRSSRELYILHELKDYVRVWLVSDDDHYQSGDTARRIIYDTRYYIGQLLPDGHPGKISEEEWRVGLKGVGSSSTQHAR